MRKIIAALSVAFLLCLAVAAQAQMNLLTGAGGKFKATVAATYQGPGDIVSGALIWGSCARVYNVSLASTSTSLCDLVDTSTGATAVCTLRGSSTGFVDLANAYCTGSLTPAAACAAASGGACRVSKVYDQIGGTSGWTNATNSQRPALTFSAINGLPGMTGTAAANTNLTTSSTFTQSVPYSWAVVAERTANVTTKQAVIGSSGALNVSMGFAASANTVYVDGSGSSAVNNGSSIADSAFHALQGVVNGASSVIAADGNETTGNAGNTAFSANTSRIMRFAGGSSMDGVWMEGGMWPGAFTSGGGGQIGNLNSNAHGANGYNF
jgi:hypothetical protein